MDIDLHPLAPGFLSPTLDAQRTFRTILEAMAHPGRILPVCEPLQPPGPLSIGAAALCLTLLDFETSLWADSAVTRPALDWLRFHCGCKIAAQPWAADFALIASPGQIPSLVLFPAGEDEYPERSATLIVQVDGLSPQGGKRLSGPGIRDFTHLNAEGLPESFWEERQSQSSLYPLGVDILFVSGRTIAALPRATATDNRICM